MWQGREIIPCTLALLAGNLLGSAFPFPPLLMLVLSACAALVSAFRPKPAPLFGCFVLLGAATVQVGRMPPYQEASALTAWAAGCKTAFSARLGTMLPEGDELAVLQSLAIGDKSGLTRDLRTAYRGSGAMHLLALSGLHVGLIYALLVRLLTPLGGYRTARLFRSFIILGSLWTYAVITGLSASITRAVLMITFYELSGLLTGGRDGLTALFASAFLLMLFRPEAPRDIGFQLSYTAVLSILLLHPRLKGMLQSRSRLLTRVWELLSVSLCCQATCGVLAWWYFGTFPRYFLVTALLAIPLATVTMYAIVGTAVAATLASVLPSLAPLATTAASLLRWLLHLLNTIIRLIASL